MSDLTDSTPRADRQARREVFDAARFVRRLVQANLELAGGTAVAVGNGYLRFGRSLTNDNVLRLGLDNGFIEGGVRSLEQTFSEMEGVLERAFSRLQADSREGSDDDAEPQRPDGG